MSKPLIPELLGHASKFASVLDIGCGPGAHLKQLPVSRRVGIDICPQEIELAKAHEDSFSTYVVGDIRKLVILFKPNAFECVMGIDIIEHFTKEDAFRLIAQCEAVAMYSTAFFVPVGIHVQNRDVRGFGNDEHQTHRSVWYPRDFRSMGYKVEFDSTYYRPQPDKERGAMICIKE